MSGPTGRRVVLLAIGHAETVVFFGARVTVTRAPVFSGRRGPDFSEIHPNDSDGRPKCACWYQAVGLRLKVG